MPVTVDLATAEETEVLLNLWQLYMKGLAEFRDSEVQADGRYRDDRLRIPFQNENPKAAAFWRRTIPELGYVTTETNLLNDVWLSFSNAMT